MITFEFKLVPVSITLPKSVSTVHFA